MPANAKVQKSRNPFIAPGVTKYGKSAMFSQRGEYKKIKMRKAAAETVAKAAAKVVESSIKKKGKDGKEYIVYKGEQVRDLYQHSAGHPSTKKKPSVGSLRASITPGTVLILLAGHFRGKRVVFLKRLDSGLLLVSGPFQVNGVPIRRVNQAYVIATSTKIDISGVKVPETINDAYFKKVREAAKPKSEEEFFKKDAKVEKKTVAAHRIADQKSVDDQLLAVIAKTPSLKEYLGARFSLSGGLFPHQIKF
jgi:large subunit ribosomal protein L6e